jgi:hypothetical protein
MNSLTIERVAAVSVTVGLWNFASRKLELKAARMWRVRGTLAQSQCHCEERSRDEAISTPDER